jgi:hypothetical protein
VVPDTVSFANNAWTDVYTLIAPNASPVTGFYLAVTLGLDGTPSYSYSANASYQWNVATNSFSLYVPTTWATVSNALFAPPPPPVVVQPIAPMPPVIAFAPPPGLAFGAIQIGAIDNPEPATGLLFATGAAALWLWRRKRAKA